MKQLTTVYTGKIAAEMPTREEVLSLAVGDIVGGVFGPAEVVEVFARDTDRNGRAFACFYQRLSTSGSTISGSMKEDTLERSLATSNAHTSAELDFIERTERKRRQIPRCAECGSDRVEINRSAFADPICCEVIL